MRVEKVEWRKGVIAMIAMSIMSSRPQPMSQTSTQAPTHTHTEHVTPRTNFVLALNALLRSEQHLRPVYGGLEGHALLGYLSKLQERDL